MIFLIGTIIFTIGSGLDVYTSYLAMTVGSKEWNPLSRDKFGYFLWKRNVLLTAILYGLLLLVHVEWVTDYQIGAGLIGLGAIRAIVALANNYPLFRKWRDENAK